MAATQTQTRNKPEHEIRSGNLKLTIWCNTSGDQHWYSINLIRAYRVDDGWKETTQLGQHDLLAASKMLEMAATWCANRRKVSA